MIRLTFLQAGFFAIGKVFRFPVFLATSRNHKVARDFALKVQSLLDFCLHDSLCIYEISFVRLMPKSALSGKYQLPVIACTSKRFKTMLSSPTRKNFYSHLTVHSESRRTGERRFHIPPACRFCIYALFVSRRWPITRLLKRRMFRRLLVTER
jgi:hypothetical protein